MSVRVRYAPSPTGFQHIGGVRTALYNYLFARSRGGTFILRIEDTDRERYVPEALQDVYDTFAWLGFHWDEGPDVGGPKGPYFQSERLALYHEHAERLLATGAAYRCWCTSERLEKLRAEQAAQKTGTGYDRHCRNLGDAERRALEASGAPSVIRLKVPLEGTTTFTDSLLGTVAVENRDVNPDPVLVKTDGFPTYHMANVVDDHLMEITHIMRAQEWLPSAPLHRILYDAFGWEQPALCHLPMVMGKDGQKLSKRHGATSVREFRKQGYLPSALINYLALVGWSYDDSREFFDLAELEKLFSMEKINKAPAVFDYQKLEWFNGSYIRKLSPKGFADAIAPVLKEAGLVAGTGPGEEALLLALTPLIQERVKLLSEVPAMVRFIFEEPAAPSAEDLLPKKGTPEKARQALQALDGLLAELPPSEEEVEARARALAEGLGMKLGDLLAPLRVAVTGSKVSPPLFESIRVMGAAKARARVALAIRILDGSPARSLTMADTSPTGAAGASPTMDTLVSLCKRRGFIFPSSEIYGGLASAWDYGPMGVELKKRIQEFWWRQMTQLNSNIVGLDAAIMMHPRVWEASGHVENFTDPLIDCRQCKHRFRVDQVPEANLAEKKCPDCGAKALTDARKFNLMFTTHMGPVEDAGGLIYLRPETAQGIYVNYKNVLQTGRVKVPFGIAQIGKAFRNEITTKNFIFRTCEFEQMEMQFFIHPSEDAKWFEHWKEKRFQYYLDLGVRKSKLRFHQHGPDELAHYAKLAFDIQYEFPFGWKELEGIHNRTDYDLKRHIEFSGKDLTYLDEVSHERYVPYIIETSAGLTRTVLVVLADAYDEEAVEGEKRVVLRFHPRVAPITVGIFPLVKKDGLAEMAHVLDDELCEEFRTFYDESGAIGRRYRRQDEVGTPYCVTLDYQTKEDQTVTIRFRDSMQQTRVKMSEIAPTIRKAIKDYKRVGE